MNLRNLARYSTSAIITFIIGVTITVAWVFYRRSSVEKSKIPPCYSEPTLKANTGIPASDSYFPPKAFSADEQLNDRRATWPSKVLAAMNEPSLLQVSACEGVSYRFLLLHTHYPPLAVRIWQSGGKQYLVVKRLGGEGGYEFGELIFEETRPITVSEWGTFEGLLNKASYWSLPTLDETFPDHELSHFIGSLWVLEGVRSPRYHIVNRWSPKDGRYRESCLYLLKLAKVEIGEPY